MCACLLLDPFQLYLEMSVCLAYPYIQPLQTATLLGMKMCCWDFFWEGGEGGSNKKVVLQVIAGNMKICTYLHVRNNPYWQDVS